MNELARMEAAAIKPHEYSTEQIELLKTQICPGITTIELNYFLEVCKFTGLDWVTNQIYAIKRSSGSGEDGEEREKKLTIQTSIAGLRVIAERTGRYLGQGEIEWCGTDGVWRTVWNNTQPPVAARCSVYKRGFEKPIIRVVHYREYVQKNRKGNPTRMWFTMPANQLGKCAEAAALRAAFPGELGDLYVPEEMHEPEPPAEPTNGHHGTTVETTAVTEPPRPQPAPAPEPPPPPPPQQSSSTEPQIPPEVRELWRIMLHEKTDGIAKVFTSLQESFIDALGDRGADVYLSHLAMHGVQSWQQFKKTGPMRQCVLAMWENLEALKAPKQAAPGVDESDIPPTNDDGQPELFEHAGAGAYLD